VILSLACTNTALSDVSLLRVRTPKNGARLLTGVASSTQLDIRIGFWGICFRNPTAATYACTSSNALSFGLIPTRTPISLAREIIPGLEGNIAIARLALGVQATSLGGGGAAATVLFVLLVANLLANLIQVYFSCVRRVGEEHVRAATWARGLDFAAAGGAIVGFVGYKGAANGGTESLTGAVANLVVLGFGDDDFGGRVEGVSELIIEGAGAGGRLFAGVVGTTVAGALVNGFLMAGDVAVDAAFREKIEGEERERKRRNELVKRIQGLSGVDGDGSGEGDKRPRAAYERFI